MKRKIITIDEEKCDGCGLCVPACAEGALAVVNGKARLVKESYCDGLGNCLGDCPRGAITMEEREADPFDEEAVNERMKREIAGGGCPGMAAMSFSSTSKQPREQAPAESMLEQWPVQLHLVNPKAPWWRNADILIAASCVPVAFGGFQSALLKGRRIVIACPKLDRTEGYVEKLTDILKHNRIASVTVAHMEVPCCSGLVAMADRALAASGKVIPYRRVKIGIQGDILEERQEENDERDVLLPM
jgi:ferredoxin